MRRATARGRMLPQSLSTDPRMGRLSLKAALLFTLIWINCDDQGRLSGDPEEVKYAVCPNIDHITKADIPELLKELEAKRSRFIKVYSTSRTEAIQMLDWWEVQRLQWAWPSLYPPPEDWQDRLRYKKSAKEVVTLNWGSPENSPENSPEKPPERSGEELGREIRSELMPLPDTVDRLAEHEAIKDKLAKLGERKGLIAKSEVNTELGRIDLLWEEPTGEAVAAFEIDVYSPREKSLTKLRDLGCPHCFVILRSNPEPLQWEQDILLIGLAKEREGIQEKEIEQEENIKRKRRGRGRGISPETSGEKPSPATSKDILDKLKYCYKSGWGKKAGGKITAQLRDLAEELSAAGCSLDYIKEAFKEAAGMNICSISYVRKILLAWLGTERGPPT